MQQCGTSPAKFYLDLEHAIDQTHRSLRLLLCGNPYQYTVVHTVQAMIVVSPNSLTCSIEVFPRCSRSGHNTRWSFEDIVILTFDLFRPSVFLPGNGGYGFLSWPWGELFILHCTPTERNVVGTLLFRLAFEFANVGRLRKYYARPNSLINYLL